MLCRNPNSEWAKRTLFRMPRLRVAASAPDHAHHFEALNGSFDHPHRLKAPNGLDEPLERTIAIEMVKATKPFTWVLTNFQ